MVLPTELQGAWGAEEATAQDFTIPRLRLLQPLSEEVGSGEKGMGEYIKSTDKSTVAKKGEAFTFVPFLMKKFWTVFDVSQSGQPKWVRQEAWTAMNDGLSWEFEEGGKKYRRDKVYSFFVIIDKDYSMKATSLPVQVNFTRSSFQTGKMLANHFATCLGEKIPPCLSKFSLESEYVNEGDKKYYVHKLKFTDLKTEMEQIKACKGWYDIVNAGKVKTEEAADDHA